MKGLIFDIERNSYVDGPGIRTTVFFKGCNLECAWCHNPESQQPKPQMMFYEDKCRGCGKCAEICPLGNISMNEGKVVWNGNCTHCMACICRCPAEAIEYGKKSPGKYRYVCPEYKPD